MKVGLCLPNIGKATSRKAIEEIGSLAEKFEFDSVWAADHLLVGKDYGSVYGKVLESLATLAYLSGRTENVKLGTSVIVFPMREVVLFAKQVAAIQILSRDRLLLGLGAGWNNQEFNNVRARFSDRGLYFDEGLQLLKWFLRGNAEFAGEVYKIDDGVFDPVPSKDIPIYIGGNGGQSLRRAAKLGDGWFPTGISARELEEGKKKLSTLTARKMELVLRIAVTFAERGQRISTQAKSSVGEVSTRLAGTPSQVLDQIERYRKIGLNHLVCYFGDRDLDILKVKATMFAKEIMHSI